MLPYHKKAAQNASEIKNWLFPCCFGEGAAASLYKWVPEEASLENESGLHVLETSIEDLKIDTQKEDPVRITPEGIVQIPVAAPLLAYRKTVDIQVPEIEKWIQKHSGSSSKGEKLWNEEVIQYCFHENNIHLLQEGLEKFSIPQSVVNYELKEIGTLNFLGSFRTMGNAWEKSQKDNKGKKYIPLSTVGAFGTKLTTGNVLFKKL